MGLGAAIATKLGHSYGSTEDISRSMTVKASPGTHVEHLVRLQEIWEVGTAKVIVNNQEALVPFNFRSDFSITISDTVPLEDCPGNEIIVESEDVPTEPPDPTTASIPPTEPPAPTEPPLPSTQPPVPTEPPLPAPTLPPPTNTPVPPTIPPIPTNPPLPTVTFWPTNTPVPPTWTPASNTTSYPVMQVGPYWGWRDELGEYTLMLNILSVGTTCIDYVEIIIDGQSMIARAITDPNDSHDEKRPEDFEGTAGISCNYLIGNGVIRPLQFFSVPVATYRENFPPDSPFQWCYQDSDKTWYPCN